MVTLALYDNIFYDTRNILTFTKKLHYQVITV